MNIQELTKQTKINRFSPIIWLWFSSGWKNRNNIKETIKNYIESGAKEFFTGYNPNYWHTKFWFEVSPNGRFAEHEQVTKKEDLEMIINEVHSYWKKVMWNLNAWYYTQEVENEIKQIVQDMIDVNIDWFICWSMWILEYLDSISEWKFEWWYIIQWKKFQINISTILAVYNADAIEFLLESYPITKVILSREVTLKEINELTKQFPNIKFETFFSGDFCRYNNGLCFAEHKYTERDICTVVLNDLVYKKGVKYDFRKIIKNEELDNNQKVKKFNNNYKNEFEELNNLVEDFELLIEVENNNELIEEEKAFMLEEIEKKVNFIQNKYILYYDILEKPDSKNNFNLKMYLKAMWILEKHGINIDKDFFNYIRTELKLWMKEYMKKIKEVFGAEYWILAENKDKLYNRSDNLNLFTAIFFNSIENIDTIKFPTRWRNYLADLKRITEVIEWKVDIMDILNLSNIYKRSHYDLNYLFDWNKKWFYNVRKELHNKILKSKD